MKHFSTVWTTTAMVFLVSTCCYGQQPQLSFYGYMDLVARDVFEREFPNGAIENPPPTFMLLRTHVLLSSRFSEGWRAFLNIRFQNGGDLGAGEHDDKGEIELGVGA